jgi:adenosylcobinamide-phosphate synthase
MSFFAILFALLVEQVRPVAAGHPLHGVLRSWARWVSRSVDAGEHSHGVLAWSLMVLAPALMVLAVHWLLVGLLGWIGVALAFVMHALVLYVTLGFRQFSHHFTSIRDALEAGDEDAARQALAQWKRVDASALPRSEIVRHVIEYSVLSAHRHVFGVLGWYAVLAALGLGPAGAVLYRMAEFVQRYVRSRRASRSPDASEALARVAVASWNAIDYVPARVTALGFAIVGNFEEAIDCWRNYAQRLAGDNNDDDKQGNEGVILAATSGAVNVRLGGEALRSAFSPNASQGFQAGSAEAGSPGGTESTPGREPQISHLRSIVGLVWRSVVLWMLLIALLTLARLIG